MLVVPWIDRGVCHKRTRIRFAARRCTPVRHKQHMDRPGGCHKRARLRCAARRCGPARHQQRLVRTIPTKADVALREPLVIDAEDMREPPEHCVKEGFEHLRVHLDNWSHASGHRRAYLEGCRAPGHHRCRRWVFLKDYPSMERCKAFLLAWGVFGASLPDAQAHHDFEPSVGSVDAMETEQFW